MSINPETQISYLEFIECLAMVNLLESSVAWVSSTVMVMVSSVGGLSSSILLFLYILYIFVLAKTVRSPAPQG